MIIFKHFLATFNTLCVTLSVLTGIVTVELPKPEADAFTTIPSAKLGDGIPGS